MFMCFLKFYLSTIKNICFCIVYFFKILIKNNENLCTDTKSIQNEKKAFKGTK